VHRQGAAGGAGGRRVSGRPAVAQRHAPSGRAPGLAPGRRPSTVPWSGPQARGRPCTAVLASPLSTAWGQRPVFMSATSGRAPPKGAATYWLWARCCVRPPWAAAAHTTPYGLLRLGAPGSGRPPPARPLCHRASLGATAKTRAARRPT